MWEIIKAGGPIMWPIIFCSIVAAAIVLERLWTLQEKRVLPRELTDQVWKWIENGQVNDKLIYALAQNSSLGKVLAEGLSNRFRPREVIERRLQDAGRHVVHELSRFINTLGTIASVAPFLGLLGTVVGIIKSFSALSTAGAGDPRMLSGGIAEALIATAAGLTVAIPTLISFRYLRGKVDGIVVQMEKEAMKLVEAIEAQSQFNTHANTVTFPANAERGQSKAPAQTR